MNRAVVYTAIFGGHDELKPPPPQDEPCDFICFTDSELPPRVGAWRVIRVKRSRDLHPRMQAKRFKMLSHRIFPGGRLAFQYGPFSFRRRVRADLSIWIDASLQIKSASFVKDMRRKLGDGDWAMFTHPDRDCIYDEASVSTGMQKYRALPIMPQADAYRSHVPPNGGLHACGIIVRREPVAQRLESVHQLWWAENNKWTYQDQISLPYVLRKLDGCDPVAITEHLWQNQWFTIEPHNSTD